MLKFQDVLHAPLGKLKQAVDDWSQMVAKLEQLAEDARNTMLANARKADWRGANASVSKSFIQKTAKEFDDAAKAAKGIKLILEDGYAAFKKAQDDLRHLIDVEAPSKQLTVSADGKVSARNPLSENHTARHDPDYETLLAKERKAIEALQKRIDAVVEACDDADQSTSRALRANITKDPHNFSAPKYDSLDAEKAQRAADLASKGTDLTRTELQQLNELLRDNHRSPVFATAFYRELGPEKSLIFFGQLASDPYTDPTNVDKQRLKAVQELQRNLGLNLATATDPDNKPHLSDKWQSEIRRLGTQRLMLNPYDQSGPYGYQLLGGIMRYGNYDAKFLNPIAEHVTQLHAKDPHMFSASKPTPGMGRFNFNPSGKNGAGFDPVVSMLEALGHSPEAAKEFFSSEPTKYNWDGTPAKGTPDLGEDAEGNKITSYMDYFGNKDYKSFPDTTSYGDDEKAKGFMPDAFGHALEAATLGHAWDDPNPKLVRDETSAGIMEDAVKKFGDAELVKHMEPISDSLGRMGAGYIDDINWALNDNAPDSMFAPTKNPESHAEFGGSGVRKFLSILGQYPDAYESMSTAGRVYTTSMLDAQVSSDGEIWDSRAREAVRTGAEVQGMLDKSRASQVEAEGLKKDEEYNKALEKRAAWMEFGAASLVGAGVAFLPATAAGAGAAAILVPLAVETGSGALTEQINHVISDWSETQQKDSKGEISEQQEEIYRAGRETAKGPMNEFMRQNNIHRDDDGLGQDLEDAFTNGYNNGKGEVEESGTTPQTGE